MKENRGLHFEVCDVCQRTKIMQESWKNDVECEQLKGMKSSASKKIGKSQKRCFCSCFVSLFRETSMQSSCLQRVIIYQNNIYQILNRDNILNASTLFSVISADKDTDFLLIGNVFGG